MITVTIHAECESLEWLEPLARHLGHIEIAIDYDQSDAIDDANVREQRWFDDEPARRPHPVVNMIDEADREDTAREIAAKKRQIAQMHKHTEARLEREAARKRTERVLMAELSPRVIAAVACTMCKAGIGQSCRAPSSGFVFGKTGHTHIARREAYANQKETQK